MKPRRSIYEIIWEILVYCKEPRKLTHIMQACNLNTQTANRILNLITEKGLLEKNSEKYRTTRKGLEYIETFNRLYKSIF